MVERTSEMVPQQYQVAKSKAKEKSAIFSNTTRNAMQRSPIEDARRVKNRDTLRMNSRSNAFFCQKQLPLAPFPQLAHESRVDVNLWSYPASEQCLSSCRGEIWRKANHPCDNHGGTTRNAVTTMYQNMCIVSKKQFSYPCRQPLEMRQQLLMGIVLYGQPTVFIRSMDDVQSMAQTDDVRNAHMPKVFVIDCSRQRPQPNTRPYNICVRFDRGHHPIEQTESRPITTMKM